MNNDELLGGATTNFLYSLIRETKEAPEGYNVNVSARNDISPRRCLMSIIPSKIEIDFTDERITASAGSVFLSGEAKKMGLPEQLKEAIKLKKRARGASDAEMLLSLIYNRFSRASRTVGQNTSRKCFRNIHLLYAPVLFFIDITRFSPICIYSKSKNLMKQDSLSLYNGSNRTNN